MDKFEIESVAMGILDGSFSFGVGNDGFTSKQAQRIAEAIAAAIETYDQQKQEEATDNQNN